VATIASLNVLLGMDSRGIGRGTKSAIANLDSLTKAALGVSSALHIASAASASVGRVMSVFRDQAQQIESISRLSSATGVSTTMLVALERGARDAGIEVSRLHEAVKKVSVAVAGGAGSQALTRLGLDATALSRAKGDDVLRRVADAIAALPNQTDKARVAMELFGRSGIDMLSVLDGGSAGFDKMRQAAEAAGETFTELEARQVVQMNRAVEHLSGVFSGVWRRSVIASSAAIDQLSTALRVAVQEARAGNWTNVQFAGLIAKGIREAKLNEALQKAAEKNREFGASLEEVAAKLEAQQKAALAARKALDQAFSARQSLIDQFATPAERFLAKQKEIIRALEQLEAQAGSLNRRDFLSQRGGLVQALERLRADESKRLAGERGTDPLAEQADAIRDQIKGPLQRYREELAKIKKLTGEVFQGPRGDLLTTGPLSFAESQLAALQARKSFLESTRTEGPDLGFRPAALERGSAAAFSASFGSRPVDRQQAELVALTRRIEEHLRRIEAADKVFDG
jgi:hypothetical protein